MVLVNGAEGIGTGWSTNIPSYNPEVLIANIRHLIRDEELEPMHPWYRGFEGEVEPVAPGKYKVSGRWEKIGNTIEITELPIGTWTQNYKEFLESLAQGTERISPSILVCSLSNFAKIDPPKSSNFESCLSKNRVTRNITLTLLLSLLSSCPQNKWKRLRLRESKRNSSWQALFLQPTWSALTLKAG